MARSCAWIRTAAAISTTCFSAATGPYFYAFDLLSLEGEDLRHLPLVERKRRLKRIMPDIESRLLYVDHMPERGRALFDAACERDLEGIVAKWKRGRYETDGVTTSWIKAKNRNYSQWTGRRELFERRRDQRQVERKDWRSPVLSSAIEISG